MRYSFGGVAGLDYTAVALVADTIGYGRLTAWDLDALRILEGDLLEEQADSQKKAEAQAKANQTIGKGRRGRR